ncbi:unnamed protein product [Bursaphelenchus xylophilus]|uniref:(pine wood nematode) hypothetical protein n=1 Tax=Bursaphelenchus xylophilus TaxID=6326 RepID=A0A1I7RYQ5_BURXY|nr:unnamed protein product [Bursaphelenchus xylophilus]CAG9092381.1 unnamed protein product [Bursaphelenchus xylophilus]
MRDPVVSLMLRSSGVEKMTTTAERREQLERHLQKFREIADERMQEKIARWGVYLPAIISATILICQAANTFIFGSFAYNFGQLYTLLDEYMRTTAAMNLTLYNSTDVYKYEGHNFERINEIDLYHDQLWTLFVAEVIELVFPIINITMFAYIIQDKKRHKLRSELQAVYLLAPALALVLSITQAFTIHVTLFDSMYTIRFLLSKLLAQLLELNSPGRFPIEHFFGCEFINDDDIVKPPCAGTIHDQVVSNTTMNVVIGIHFIPIVIGIYLFLQNLKSTQTDHLFLYIESVDPAIMEKMSEFKQEDGENPKRKTLRDTVKEMLMEWNVKFIPKRIFDLQMGVERRLQRSKSTSSAHELGHTAL